MKSGNASDRCRLRMSAWADVEAVSEVMVKPKVDVILQAFEFQKPFIKPIRKRNREEFWIDCRAMSALGCCDQTETFKHVNGGLGKDKVPWLHV